jgi:hypothetical protein
VRADVRVTNTPFAILNSMLFTRKPHEVPPPENTLPGRDTAIPVTEPHVVLGTPIEPPFPSGIETAVFGMGCFWGAERLFWQLPGVYTTAVGYAGGTTPNPTYQETCSGRTGHTEVVLVAYDPTRISYDDLPSGHSTAPRSTSRHPLSRRRHSPRRRGTRWSWRSPASG